MTYLVDLLFSFRGRIGRKAWWLGFVIVGVANIAGGLLLNPEQFTAEELPPPDWADTFWLIAWLLPGTAITVKRFNDRDWPAWLGYLFAPIGLLVYLAPHFPPAPADQMVIRAVVACVFGAYMLFALVDNGFLPGTAGPNRYGPDPSAGVRQTS